MPFNHPHNWCDSRCERCPLAKSCPIAVRAEQLAWVHRANGRDPDSEEARRMDIETELTRAAAMLEDELGPMALEDVEPLVESLDERRVKRAMRVTCEELLKLREYIETEDAAAALREFERSFSFAAPKAGRIAFTLNHGNEAFFDDDAAPNLLVLENALARARGALAVLATTHDRAHNVARAFEAFARVCDPFLARITDAHRDELAARIEGDEAPSPFVVTTVHG